MFTYAIYPVRQKPALDLPRSLQLTRGSDQYADGIVDCLNRNGARKQLAPYWTCESLFTSNLSPSDVFVVLNGERVVACLACWDQNSFKQTVVRGYSGSLSRWRKMLNVFSFFSAWPYLPEPNTSLRYSYASHLAIDDDDPAIFAALLRAIYNHNLERGYSYFVIGLAETNPLRAALMTYRPLTYVSQLYLVTWDDGREFIEVVDKDIIPAPEIAVL